MLFDRNQIIVHAEGVASNDIVIKSLSDEIVYENNRKVRQIPRAYGGIDFKILHKGQLIGQAGIHNTNWWHSHDFVFDFTLQHSKADFTFKVDGPDAQSLVFKHLVIDSTTNNVQTERFYNSNGPTGQVNKLYFNNLEIISFDETWINDTLTSLNLYKNGEWIKNYSVNKYHKGLKYELQKVTSAQGTAYEYKTHSIDTVLTERIEH